MKGLPISGKILARKQLAFLVAAIFFFIVAIGLDVYLQNTTTLSRYIPIIEKNLHQQEKQIEDVFNDRGFIRRLIQTEPSDIYQLEEDTKRLQKLAKEDFTILVYKRDSLLFWSNNITLPYDSDLVSRQSQRINKLVILENGYYELVQQPFYEKGDGTYDLVGLIPIKHNYRIQSGYLSNTFVADQDIPTEIEIDNQVSSHPISSKNGKPIAFLSTEGPMIDQSRLMWLQLVYFIAFLLLGIFVHSVAKKFSASKIPWLGAAFLIVVVFSIRLITVAFGMTNRFSELPIFSKTFETPVSSSLGDLLINIILLLWVMLFFHKETKLKSYNHLSLRVKIILAALNYFSILLGLCFTIHIFKTLVFNTSLIFDFENVFNLDQYSMLAILSVILLLVALFLFGHRMMLTIKKLNLERNYRLGALTLAMFASVPIIIGAKLIFPTIYLFLVGLVFLLLFDMFVDNKKTKFVWLVIWLVILSAFPSVLLLKYNIYKDRLQRLSYAKELANPRDTVVENSLSRFKDLITQDAHLRNRLIKPYPFQMDRDTILRRLNKFYARDNYLLNNYEFKVSAFNKFEEPAINGQQQGYNLLKSQLRRAAPVDENDIYFSTENGPTTYYLKTSIQPGQQSDDQLQFIFEVNRNYKDRSKVYTELLVDQPFKNLDKIDKYEYAVYKEGKILDSKGSIYGPLLTAIDIPPPGENREITHGDRSDIIYADYNDKVVIIGKKKEIFTKAISLFSFIFTILIILFALLSGVNTFAKILPSSLIVSWKRKPSLKNRIQLSVISLIITSFLIIGIVTVWFFQNSSEDYHEKRLERKTLSVLTGAVHEVELRSQLRDTTPDYNKILKPLSKIHRIDINLYNDQGRLIGSSEDGIFKKGVISEKMDAVAFRKLSIMNEPEFIQDQEKIGNLIYKSAYVPLKVRTELGEKTVAFLGIPYYSNKSNQRNDVSIFMSTLLNVYVFLLLIAVGIAIAVANSITKPLSKIGDKLKDVKIGKRNEPIEWKSKDELGTLIDEYNLMIAKLSASAEKLAQSEREDAWREMAKQVAHEIKNPLTPMKLSIQYLQHAYYRSDQEDIGPMLKKVCGTLIEQIDNLAQIASEFSNFAKMPRAENQEIELNQLVQSVLDLFSNKCRELSLDLNLSMPDEQYVVYADRNHLMRVLNNLVKNAIQAIPDERKGRIQVFVFRKDERAIIKVSDNGTGIPKDKRDKVFVPNFTTKSSGTGLGLAISKSIIESVNGEIYFNTVENEGTDFFVKLPLIDVKELVED